MFPGLVFAQIPGITPIPTPVTDIEGLIRIIDLIADIIFTVFMIVAVILLLIAAFYYLTAFGEPAQIGKAHRMLIYAAVAIAVALLARSIPFIVKSVVESQGAGTPPPGQWWPW
jgi:hypothetical protein